MKNEYGVPSLVLFLFSCQVERIFEAIDVDNSGKSELNIVHRHHNIRFYG